MMTITFDEHAHHAVIVATDAPASVRVNLGPAPTWPTPAEQVDLITDGVRSVLEAVHYFQTGQEVER